MPETTFLEAVEASVLFLLLPVPWRDYGNSVNLRVIKEEGTLSHDEGLVFAPDDDRYDEPLRFGDAERLLERWSLTSLVRSCDLKPLLWQIIEHDPEVRTALPLVIERWERDFDRDPELVAMAARVRSMCQPDTPLVQTLRVVGATGT